MIHAIGQDLSAALAARRCPIRVFDASDIEQVTNVSVKPERITIERDEDAGDSFRAPRGATPRANPQLRGVRNIGVKLTVYAQSPAAGAKAYEHERRAERILDLLYCSIQDVASARKNGVEIKGGKFVRSEDAKASDVKGGATYELRLTWERGITDKPWDDVLQPEITVGAGVDELSFNNTTHVRLPGGTPETV